jgi:E3 ubiquitin-protein ligase HUWE1
LLLLPIYAFCVFLKIKYCLFVTRSCGGKKSSQTSTPSSNVDIKPASGITIHPGASAVVCRHTLDVLIALAKSFPTHYLPWKEMSASSSMPSTGIEFSSTETSTPKPKSGQAQCKKDSGNDFWDTLLRLDQQSSSRKGKSVARSHSNVSSFIKSEYESEESSCTTFDASPFGQLLGMLSCPVIRRSSVLTDKLLRLLSYISLGQPESSKKAMEAAEKSKASQDPSTSNAVRANTVGPEHIQLAVQVCRSNHSFFSSNPL